MFREPKKRGLPKLVSLFFASLFSYLQWIHLFHDIFFGTSPIYQDHEDQEHRRPHHLTAYKFV